MYYLCMGQVEVIHEASGRVFDTIPAGSLFGETALLMGSGKRNATIKCLTDCNMFILEKNDLDAILEDFNKERMFMVSLAHARLSANAINKLIGSPDMGSEEDFTSRITKILQQTVGDKNKQIYELQEEVKDLRAKLNAKDETVERHAQAALRQKRAARLASLGGDNNSLEQFQALQEQKNRRRFSLATLNAPMPSIFEGGAAASGSDPGLARSGSGGSLVGGSGSGGLSVASPAASRRRPSVSDIMEEAALSTSQKALPPASLWRKVNVVRVLESVGNFSASDVAADSQPADIIMKLSNSPSLRTLLQLLFFLRSASQAWMVEFIESDGLLALEALSLLYERMNRARAKISWVTVMKQVVILDARKSILNHRQVLDIFIGMTDQLRKLLVSALLSNNTLMQTQVHTHGDLCRA